VLGSHQGRQPQGGPPGPPMTLANMRSEVARNHEINHLAESTNFLAAYEAGTSRRYGKPSSIAPGTAFRCGNGWPPSF
jgi:hypothetical protein